MLRNIHIFLRTTLVLISCLLIFPISFALAGDVNVEYQTHVQDMGWQDSVTNGELSGTTGSGLRLEGIRVYLGNLGSNDLGVSYRTHVQDYGWQDWVNDNRISGTVGEAKRLEAIEINLEGADKDKYNIYYRVHSQTLGWLGWAKNGEESGTSGMCRRLEAIEIKILPSSEAAPISEDSQQEPFYSLGEIGGIHYRSHVSNLGWQDYCFDGQTSGTTGQNCPTEALSIGLSDSLVNGTNGVKYKVKQKDSDWTDWLANDTIAGVTGEAKPIEAVRIALTGTASVNYDVYYRTHITDHGWLGWAKNGAAAGSEGLGSNIEAIEIKLVAKKQDPPGDTDQPYMTEKGIWRYPLDDYTIISSYFGPRDGRNHNGVDFPAPTGTPIHAVTSGEVYFAGGTDDDGYGLYVAIENDSGEKVKYAHMSRIAAEVGDYVNRGDIIGYVGDTGNATGPHVHLEVTVPPDDEYVDPLTYYDYYYEE